MAKATIEPPCSTPGERFPPIRAAGDRRRASSHSQSGSMSRLSKNDRATGSQAPLPSSNAENIHLRLQPVPQREVIGANLKPARRLLVEVEATTDLDHPAIIDTDLPVMHGGAELDL